MGEEPQSGGEGEGRKLRRLRWFLPSPFVISLPSVITVNEIFSKDFQTHKENPLLVRINL